MSNNWFDCGLLSVSLHAQTLMMTDVQTPFQRDPHWFPLDLCLQISRTLDTLGLFGVPVGVGTDGGDHGLVPAAVQAATTKR